MTDTTITPEERAQWRDRLTSPLSCHDAEHASFTLRLLDALEAAEKERDELETYIAKLVYVLTDGKLSKPYDIAVIAEEVENIYQEYFRNELEPKLQKAEAENAQLQKMVEWLAAELSDGCFTSRCILAIVWGCTSLVIAYAVWITGSVDAILAFVAPLIVQIFSAFDDA